MAELVEKMAALKADGSVNPSELAIYGSPKHRQTLCDVLKKQMPEHFNSRECELTPEIAWLDLLLKISSVHEQFRERRRFILHWPGAAPFELSILLDLGDPVRSAPAGIAGCGAGDPLIPCRYIAHRKAAGQQAGQAIVLDFYKRQRDGFLNAEAAVVPVGDSVVGLQAHSLASLEAGVKMLERFGGLLHADYAAKFKEGPKPSFLCPIKLDLSGLGEGAYVELHSMKTESYNGLQGVIVGRAENHPDRWAVMPQAPDHVAKAKDLRGGDKDAPLRPLAIKPDCLKVVDRPAEAEAEDCD